MTLSVHYASKQSDSYFGQWLVANVPVRSVHVFLDAVCPDVSEQRKWFAVCVHLRGDLWGSALQVRRYWLQENAHDGVYLESLLYMYKAWFTMTNLEMQRRVCLTGGMPDTEVDYDISSEQQLIAQRIIAATLNNVGKAERGECITPAAFAILGGPGTGKTLLMKHIVREITQTGGRCAICCPTGALADDYRGSTMLKHAYVDTIAGACKSWQEEPPSWMASVSFVAIDEVGFVDGETFEHIMSLWELYECSFVIAFAGDFCQLSPPSGTCSAKDNPKWQRLQQLRLRCAHRTREPAFLRVQRQLRWGVVTRTTMQQLVGRRVVAEIWPMEEHWRDFFMHHPGFCCLAV
jgi:hypothetical protein